MSQISGIEVMVLSSLFWELSEEPFCMQRFMHLEQNNCLHCCHSILHTDFGDRPQVPAAQSGWLRYSIICGILAFGRDQSY